MNGFLRLIDGMLSFAFVMLLLAAGVGVWLHRSFDEPGPLATPAVIVVPKGEGALEVAERLEKSGVIGDRRVFMLQYYASRLYGTGNAEKSSLKAGEYQLPASATVRQVLDTISSGRGVLQKITVPEGLTSAQIVERLRAEPGLAGEIVEIPAEGTLLPDTYRFARGASRQDIIDRMKAEHSKLVAALWATRDQTVPLQTPEQAVTLASIVEKETGKAEERPRVAAVFVNRLRRNMRLQSDPTIIYGIVGGQGPLGRAISRADIDGKTPYNTYQIDGLPPGPICNPGRAAIAAAVNPPTTQDLFFVADGTGGHAFTSTLKDHNAAVQNWRRIERSKQGGSADPAAGQAPAAAKGPSPAPTLLNSNRPAAEEKKKNKSN